MKPKINQLFIILTIVAIVISVIFLLLTFMGWLTTEPGFEPLNALVASILSALFGLLSWLKSRKQKKEIEEAKMHDMASRIITFFEGRRVLYGPLYKNCPGGIIQTIKPIREKLQSEMENIERGTSIYEILARMRDATLEFLNFVCKDCPTPETCDQCAIHQQGGCIEGLVEYRRKIVNEIIRICDLYQIRVCGELTLVLPGGEFSNTLGDLKEKKLRFIQLKDFLNQINEIKTLNSENLDVAEWKRTIRSILLEIFGKDSYYVKEFSKIEWPSNNKEYNNKQNVFLGACASVEGLLTSIVKIK